MRPTLSLILLALSTITLGCDPAAESCDDAPAVDGLALGGLNMAPPAELDTDPAAIAFREQGPPQGLVLTKLNGKTINRAAAKSMIDACIKQVDPPQTCSISWYQPDTSQPERVLGVGCSMMASWPLFKCYFDYMTAQGAKPY